MNNWNIPAALEREIIERDEVCIYCGVRFTSFKDSKKRMATWEHIINDTRIITKENIALCCCSCNASKGIKDLSEWLETSFCKRKGITKRTIAPVAKQALSRGQQ